MVRIEPGSLVMPRIGLVRANVYRTPTIFGPTAPGWFFYGLCLASVVAHLDNDAISAEFALCLDSSTGRMGWVFMGDLQEGWHELPATVGA